MTIAAVLWDVGGPLDTEVLHEQGIDESLIRAFAAEGLTITPAALAQASDEAVAAFAPQTYAAMAWSLARNDLGLYDRVWARFRSEDTERSARRGGIELRPGIGELLHDLHGNGLKLGLAANQPSRIITELDRHGIGALFSHREVSGHHGFHKPDVRLFLRACEDLGVEPGQCLMVGDRVDNDIAPAKLLGMKAVLFRTGRHIRQLPRSPAERPDAEVRDVAELRAALQALCA